MDTLLPVICGPEVAWGLLPARLVKTYARDDIRVTIYRLDFIYNFYLAAHIL